MRGKGVKERKERIKMGRKKMGDKKMRMNNCDNLNFNLIQN